MLVLVGGVRDKDQYLEKLPHQETVCETTVVSTIMQAG